jgi:hypothetical protein
VSEPKRIPLSVVARFVGPGDPDENGVILSVFLTCYEGTDLSNYFANYAAGMVRADALRRKVITEAHTCTFIGMRAILPDELTVLLSFLGSEHQP